MLILAMLTLLFATQDASYSMIQSISTHGRLLTVTNMLQSDLHSAGIGVPDSADTFLTADSTRILFLGDIDLDGTADSLHYFLDEIIEQSGDTLYAFKRLVGSVPENIESLGEASVKFSFYDGEGNAAVTPGGVRCVGTRLKFLNVFEKSAASPQATLEWRTLLVNIDN